jgi:lipopolysaccharide export system permease protein
MVIYVSDSQAGPFRRGIFIADDRNPADSRVIVAGDYALLNDPGNSQIGLRLLNGTVHSHPSDLEQYHQVSFSSYDLKLSLDQSVYAAVDERPSREAVLAQLERSNWQDAGALRRLMESYKDLAFPTAALIFGILGVPIGIVSKRSGRIGGFAVGVGIVIAYYVLNVLCEFFVTTLVLPPFAGAWLPNVLFFAVTVALFIRMNRQ